jgi:hypothetical protein
LDVKNLIKRSWDAQNDCSELQGLIHDRT